MVLQSDVVSADVAGADLAGQSILCIVDIRTASLSCVISRDV